MSLKCIRTTELAEMVGKFSVERRRRAFPAWLSCVLMFLLATTLLVRAETVSLTFQGTLQDLGRRANRSYDWRFTVYDGPVRGNAISEPVTNAATRLTNGAFTATFVVDLDVLKERTGWIEVGVRPAGSTGDFTTFGSRHEITAPPPAPPGEGQGQSSAPAQSGASPLSQLSKKQAELMKSARGLLNAQQKASSSAMQSAAEALQNANNAISPLSAGALGQMPAGAQSALQSAQGSTSQGSAQAAGGQNSPAQMSATSAAQALAQAQAALALAQAGVGSEAAMGQGEDQGQGKGKGKGKGKGEGEGEGQSQANSKGQGRGQPGAQGNGDKGNWDGAGGADGPRQGTAGSSSFTRLPGRDRAALQQSQAEKYPQEYGPLVEQYLRNLSDQAADK